MTVGELKLILNKYNDDTNVKIAIRTNIKDLCYIADGVDMDTNIMSVWLCGDNEKI